MIFYGFPQPIPADARALAQQHLVEINDRISFELTQDVDAMSHLQELHTQIAKVLGALVQVNEP